MNYLDSVFSYFFPITLSFQKLSADAIFGITSYLSPSDVCSLAFVERHTFSVFTNTQGLASSFANAIIKEKKADFILDRPNYILNNVRKLFDLKFQSSTQLEKLLIKLTQLEQISFFKHDSYWFSTNKERLCAEITNKTVRLLSIYCVGLKVLDLPDPPFEEDYIPTLARLTALKTLRLFGTCIENFPPLLKNLTQLTNLRLPIKTSKIKDVDNLFLFQKNLNKLHLSIEDSQTNEFQDNLLLSMTSLTNLTSLSLNFSISKLDPINHLTRLNKFELYSTDLSQAEIQKVGQLKHLKKIALIGSKSVTNSACQAICQQFPQLQILDLSYTDITDEGIDLFINLKNLKVLTISGCNVSIEKINQIRQRGMFAHQYMLKNY